MWSTPRPLPLSYQTPQTGVNKAIARFLFVTPVSSVIVLEEPPQIVPTGPPSMTVTETPFGSMTVQESHVSG